VVGGEHSNALQRHTTSAEVRHYQISTFPAKRLIDCHIEFMADTSFALAACASARPIRIDRSASSEAGGSASSMSRNGS